MNKTTAGKDGGRGTESTFRDDSSAAFEPCSFRIRELERCAYGSKVATGKAEIEGFGVFGFEFFVPRQSGRPFVAAESIRDKYTGAYRRSVEFSPEFSAELLEAIEARLAADEIDEA